MLIWIIIGIALFFALVWVFERVSNRGDF